MSKHWQAEITDSELGTVAGRGTSRIAHLMLFLILAFFVCFLLWAHNATLEEVTRGEGRIVPSSQIQVVQHFEGGIVTDILVEEGEAVEQGQVLLHIENRLADAGLAEKTELYRSLLAKGARLSAESGEADTITFPGNLADVDPEMVDNERFLFESRRDQLEQQIEILIDQRKQKQQEMEELTARVARLEIQLDLAREEETIMVPLVAQNLVPRIDLLRVTQDLEKLRAEIESATLSLPRIRTAINEANRRIQERRVAFVTEARQELNEVRAQSARVREEIEAGTERAGRSEVRSPVRGTVNKLATNTIGGVVRAGDPVAEIVPLEDSLLVEARIKPSDRAQLYRGLPATVKISAYDFTIHGGLDGVLVDISADTILDEQGESYYRIRLKTNENQLADDKPIIPGMTATVDILTGEKTVLQYLLKPITKARQDALRER